MWALAGLAVGAYFLSDTFRSAAGDSFDTSLQVDLDGMIAAAEPDPGGVVVLQDRFLNRRFARAYSGLYWQIAPAKGGAVQISHSLLDRTLKIRDTRYAQGFIWGYADGPDNQHLRVLARRISFAVTATPDPKDERSYVFIVAGDLAGLDAQIADFNGTLFWSFAVLFAGLVFAVFLQVRIGLLPLRSVGEALARIRSGEAQRLEGKFPSEIAPLASELNSLIEHSVEVVGRARSSVANLAHFLKTPLTVLATEAEATPGPFADNVRRQVGVMRRQIDHYLSRARTAGALNVLGNRTPVRPVLEDLARVLRRIHAERGVVVAVTSAPSLYFRGERQDLEEMVGNLMDNACKWGRSQVAVEARREADGMLLIRVDDDGPGLAPGDLSRVLGRGERLDESVPGSGLGLSIVRDIAKLYRGGLEMGKSTLGGLSAVLKLPAIG